MSTRWNIVESVVYPARYLVHSVFNKTWQIGELLPPECVTRYKHFFSIDKPLALSEATRQRLFFAELSMLAYSRNTEECHELLKPLKLEEKEMFIDMENKTSDTNILAFAQGEQAFLAFRGTEPFSVVDWTTDSHFRLIPFPQTHIEANVQVHEGFYNATADLLTIENMVRLLERKKTIWISGHSLGGALAVMFATQLRTKRAIPSSTRINVITYGTPQVGNDAFVELFKELDITCQQTINDMDVVPRLAHLCDSSFSTLPMGKLYLIDRFQSVKELDPHDRIPAIPSLIPGLNNLLARSAAEAAGSIFFPSAVELANLLANLTSFVPVNPNLLLGLRPFLDHSPRFYVEAAARDLKGKLMIRGRL